jgi:hypothetical protein
MYSLENHVGRLVEARLGAPFTVDEVDAWLAKMRVTVAQCRHGVICCIDLLRVDVLAPASAERFLEMMREHNLDVQRTGFLIPTGNAILGLQVDRLIRDAQSSKRKAFRDATSLEAWLVPVMTMQEAQQLRKFLAALG